MVWLIVLLVFVLLVLVWGVTFFYLKGENLGAFDDPKQPSMSGDSPPSEGLLATEEMFATFSTQIDGGSGKTNLASMRALMDSFGGDVEFDGEIVPVDSDGIVGEWVIPPGADASIRTLYIHGGAFVMGSPRSHRQITTEYAHLTGGVVFSLDYRLMPENKRQAGIDDCRAAYQWLLDYSPSSRSKPKTLYVSGDSAGGSLSLSLSRWVCDNGLRRPDAVVALSPATDSGFNNPSTRDNIATDKMLGPAFGKLSKIPGWILLWMAWFRNRISPAKPSVSPIMGDLSGLPPTLVHASEVEMLLDDARRYVNKARASGSPVTLQTWNHVMHVWQMFHPTMPEAREAMNEIGNFLQQHAGAARAEKTV